MSFQPVARDDAVKAIAEHLADRTAFVAVVPPDLTDAVAARLAAAGEFSCYLDNGTDLIARLDHQALVYVAATAGSVLGIETIGVFVVPKTVPAAAIGKALGQDVAVDGSRDILVVQGDGPIYWPLIFVEALDRVDPRAAATLRANSLENLS